MVSWTQVLVMEMRTDDAFKSHEGGEVAMGSSEECEGKGEVKGNCLVPVLHS